MFQDVLFTVSQLKWNSIIDIALVALIFYWMLVLIQGTKAVQLLRGILILVVVAVTITTIFDLTAFKWLISNSLPALLISIPVIFQPELRRALERLGRTGYLIPKANANQDIEITLKTIAAVAQKLSYKGFGALIVLERETGLEDYIETGIRVEGKLSEELILSIFFPNTPMHDGAVIIRNGQITAASCLLPLSRVESDGPHLGTRHRAAIGLTESTDAIVIVVSEETGSISIVNNGRIIRNLDEARLLKILYAFYRSQINTAPPAWHRFKRLLPGKKPQ